MVVVYVIAADVHYRSRRHRRHPHRHFTAYSSKLLATLFFHNVNQVIEINLFNYFLIVNYCKRYLK